jgi:hypothetical protein
MTNPENEAERQKAEEEQEKAAQQKAADIEKQILQRTDARLQAREKYCYFLMAAAGACLGYGLQKLDGQPRSPTVFLALPAFACWFLSVWCGCKSIERYDEIQDYAVKWLGNLHAAVLRILPSPLKALTDPDWRDKEQQAQKRYTAFRKGQFNLLALGVIFFAIWRVAIWWQAPEPPPNATLGASEGIHHPASPGRATSAAKPTDQNKPAG